MLNKKIKDLENQIIENQKSPNPDVSNQQSSDQIIQNQKSPNPVVSNQQLSSQLNDLNDDYRVNLNFLHYFFENFYGHTKRTTWEGLNYTVNFIYFYLNCFRVILYVLLV